MNPAMLEDRSGLFNEISGFSQRKLKKVETKVCTGTGENVVEKRGAKGLQTVDPSKNKSSTSNEPLKKLDLQVGLVAPGIMIGSHDVAHHKETLEEYGITHILNVASEEIENSFEDDLNYVSLQIDDNESTQLEQFYEEAFDFLDDGKQRGNCLIHCNANKPGLSRSTSICIAYLMTKEKKRFMDAFNDVKEARSFVRPSDHFMKQLESLDAELFGGKKKDEIEDAFTKKKREEIEAEKAMLKSQGVKLKDRAKMFAEHVTQERSQSPVPGSVPGSLSKKWQPVGNDHSRRGSFVPEYLKNENRSDSEYLRNENRSDSEYLRNENRSDSIDSQTGQPRKLTSIISLFNKPKDENSNTIHAIVKNEHRPSFSLNTAPAKKWKTVEPPPRPGFLKKNKSRRFLTGNESIKRNKSKGSFVEKSKGSFEEKKSKELKVGKQSMNESVDEKMEREKEREKMEKKTQENGGIKRTTSRQDSAIKSVPPPPPPPPPMVTKSKLQSSEPVPPPPAPVSKPTPPTAKSTPPPDDDPTPWRRSSSRTPEPKLAPVQVQHSIDSEYRMKPDETRYKSSITVNPARRGSRTEPEPEPERKTSVSNKVTPMPDVIPTPAPPTSKMAPPTSKMVFGKVKPPPMKIVGSSLSTTSEKGSIKPQSKPEGGKREEVSKLEGGKREEVSKPEAGKREEVRVQPKPSYQKSVSVDDEEEEEEEEESEEEEDDEDEDDEYTHTIYRNNDGRGSNGSYTDSRRVSEVKGLNRSSTTEILKLIKSKTGADLTQNLETLDEDEESGEIDQLLQGLEEEGIDNIDWGELGIDVVEVKSIVNKHENDEEEEEEEEDEEEEEETEEEEEEVPCVVTIPGRGLRAK